MRPNIIFATLPEELPETCVALGAVKIFHEWDWPGVGRELRRAVEPAPDSVDGHNLYGFYLQAVGRQDEAVEEVRKATQSAPQWVVATHDQLESTFGA